MHFFYLCYLHSKQQIVNYFIETGIVTNSSDDLESLESSLDLNNLKEYKKQQPRKKKFKLDNVEMNFNCGWVECVYESSSIKDYFNHVSDHVDYLWTEEWQSNKESTLYFSFLFKNNLKMYFF